jgi:hypothetical protein
VRSSLGARGLEITDADIGGRPVVAGQRSDFSLRRFAARLHTSVLLTRLHADETGHETPDGFLEAATRWAVEHRSGGTLGLQSGVAAIAAVAMDELTSQARDWASTPHGRKFAVVAYPVAIGVGTREVIQPRLMVIGAVFSSFLQGFVRDVLQSPLSQDSR